MSKRVEPNKTNEKDEVSKYLDLELEPKETIPLKWWHDHRLAYPTLYLQKGI